MRRLTAGLAGVAMLAGGFWVYRRADAFLYCLGSGGNRRRIHQVELHADQPIVVLTRACGFPQ